MNRTRRAAAHAGWVFLFLLAGCSDSTSPAGLTVNGGPDNPAPDGSYTAPILSENGIASLEPVMLGGVEQWILIRGYDVDNPVLIFLHGGPGSPGIPYARYSMGGLERRFTVVTWDQRGCGKSYTAGIDPESITLEQMLSDTHDLITMMIGRFGKEKVYLMGISWGSILGTFTARNHPELLHAYIGIGQAVNAERGFRVAHEAALDKATELDYQDAIESLSGMQTDPVDWDQMGTLFYWLEEFGFGDLHDTSQYPALVDSLRAATEYTPVNIANDDNWRALYASSPLLSDETWLRTLDLINQLPEFDSPIYFLAGRFDYKTPAVLVQEYLAALQAPAKQIFFFENSSHMPNIEEREAFHSALINGVLAGTTE